ncbi:hypothetical protein E2493_05275 [Sphingomonas parva]|uniref:Uncharacterized protein n=1 Tax=Sphingomonas parva TaxID=2555898 RepID=A0A4Y8ZVU9_9SPHN|nr:hypothetical protein [Sphingomonas parva]TFI59255.1 hypothetical protein E2493_05275 [Sphingomonas parva]
MRLACRLGFHRPQRPALWNAGYYFSRCARCRRDLIKTPWGRWRVPRGFRVVWKTASEAALGLLLRDVREAPGAKAGPLRTSVPLQTVLRRLHHQDFMGDERRRSGWDGEIEVAVDDAFRRIDRSDFMAPRAGDMRAGEAAGPAAQPVRPPLGQSGRR